LALGLVAWRAKQMGVACLVALLAGVAVTIAAAYALFLLMLANMGPMG
jgi:hypothetical protein